MTTIRKPTPDQLAELRAANPKGAPRFDYREMLLTVERAADAQGDGGEESETIPVAISSEQAVLRYDFWNDELYYEVLDHSEKSIDLSYSKDGLPFIAGHRAWDADSQHGIVENIRAEKKVLRGDIRMSRAARSQEIKNDLVDGIRKKVSVGYIVGDEYEQSKPDRDGIPTRRYLGWMPIEVSTVPVPADYDVGIGRAKSVAGQAALARFLELHPSREQPSSPTTPPPKGKEGTMAEPANAPAGGPSITDINERANAAAVQRIADITALATTHKCDDKLSEWIRSGKSVAEITTEINTVLSKRLADVGTVQTSRGVELNEKDYSRFSYARILMMDGGLQKVVSEAGGAKVDIGLEREVVQEALRRSPMAQGAQAGDRIFVPFVVPKGRAVDSSVSTTGGPFKFTSPGDFIDMLRNKTSVMRAGATVLPGLQGPLTFPKQTGAGSASWRAENPGSDISRADLTAGTVSLALKTVQAAMAVSRQAILAAAGGNYDLEQIIRNDLAAIIALAIDLGGLNGSGSSNQPLGILQDTSVGTAAALGTAGGTMAWSNWVALETAVGDANAETARMSYITNTKQRGVAKNKAVLDATAAGIPIWGGDPNAVGVQATPSLVVDGIVNGYRAIASNQVPRNLTKGSNTTVCSAVVFGAFEHLLIGMFGAGFEVLVDPYTLKLQGLIDLTAWSFVDVANRHPTAFATIKDAL